MKNKLIIVIVSLIILAAVFFFDKGLSLGLGLLAVLSIVTFFVLSKLGFKDKKIYLLFLIVLMIHLATTLFMYYADFQPFSSHGGDYEMYQKSATEAAQSFRQGIFLVKGIVSKYPDFYTGHFYPLLVGAIYTLTTPAEIIGLMLNVWFVAITIVFVYLIILEIGGEVKNAFVIGLITALYPSYVFNSGLLLKDAVEISLTILVLLFLIKTVKKFSWFNSLILYLALICVTNLRFYLGYALIITFLISWFLFSKLDFKKRVIYGTIFFLILGVIPQISAGQGYYGIDSVKTFLNSQKINFYRQVAYNPAYWGKTPSINHGSATNSVVGLDSSFTIEKGPVGYVKSSIYVLLGPFPWQIKNSRQSLALVETIPWYLLLFFVVDGTIVLYKKRIKEAVPLLIFSVLVLVVIAIFDTNFGLIVRIRIPAFISLLCIGAFGFNKNNIVYNYSKKIYEKIFSYGRSRIYRKPLS